MKLFYWFYSIYTWFVSKVCWRKRLARRMELETHVQAILDCHGNRLANSYLAQVAHLLEYWHLKLRDAGFKGTFEELRQKAQLSMDRAAKRESETMERARPKQVA